MQSLFSNKKMCNGNKIGGAILLLLRKVYLLSLSANTYLELKSLCIISIAILIFVTLQLSYSLVNMQNGVV